MVEKDTVVQEKRILPKKHKTMTMPWVKPELRNSEFDLLILSFMATSTSSITDHIYSNRKYNQTSNFVLYAYTLAMYP